MNFMLLRGRDFIDYGASIPTNLRLQSVSPSPDHHSEIPRLTTCCPRQTRSTCSFCFPHEVSPRLRPLFFIPFSSHATFDSPLPLQYTLACANSDNPSFLNDLAAKMAAGPPKKPVGLVKKPALDAKSASLPTQPSEAEKELGQILKSSIAQKSAQHESVEPNQSPKDQQN